jgi:DNA-binding transcriptional regulator YhcF (GntR family)
MTSAYTHQTAIRIYEAIASSQNNGMDVEQVAAAAGLAMNTVRTYCRWLEKDGSIEIKEINSTAINRPLKNLYFAIQPPEARHTDQQRLEAIATLLEPYASSATRATKAQMIAIMQQSLNVARKAKHWHPCWQGGGEDKR